MGWDLQMPAVLRARQRWMHSRCQPGRDCIPYCTTAHGMALACYDDGVRYLLLLMDSPTNVATHLERTLPQHAALRRTLCRTGIIRLRHYGISVAPSGLRKSVKVGYCASHGSGGQHQGLRGASPPQTRSAWFGTWAPAGTCRGRSLAVPAWPQPTQRATSWPLSTAS